jgi:hypothetical protein
MEKLLQEKMPPSLNKEETLGLPLGWQKLMVSLRLQKSILLKKKKGKQAEQYTEQSIIAEDNSNN